MKRFAWIALCAPLIVAGCGGESVWAPDERVAAVRYRAPGPAKLTLYTMISNRSGSGAHTSLMINASERVIFDPAGTVRHSSLVERNDVLFGITPSVEDFYVRAHARETFHVLIQELEVSPEVAEMALQMAKANGPAMDSTCARTTSSILSRLPGFSNIKTTWYPLSLAEEFERIPGVTSQKLYEYDDDDKSVALRAYNPDLAANATARAIARKNAAAN